MNTKTVFVIVILAILASACQGEPYNTPQPTEPALHQRCSESLTTIPAGGWIEIDGNRIERVNTEEKEPFFSYGYGEMGYNTFFAKGEENPVAGVYLPWTGRSVPYPTWFITWCGGDDFAIWQNPKPPQLTPPATSTPVAIFSSTPQP